MENREACYEAEKTGIENIRERNRNQGRTDVCPANRVTNQRHPKCHLRPAKQIVAFVGRPTHDSIHHCHCDHYGLLRTKMPVLLARSQQECHHDC